MDPMDSPAAERRLRSLELVAVVLLLFAGLRPRLRDFDAGFDRGFEGFQGAFFAICAVNYERLGVGALDGYPVAAIDVDAEDPESWYEYANHPPLVPLLAWASARLIGPAGWELAWQEGRAPPGLEAALRLPFVLLNLGALLGLWWCLREGEGRATALVGLALYAALPIAGLYSTLVNYENPAVCFTLLGCAAHARWVRTSAARAQAAALLAFALAGCVTYTPLFFIAALALERLRARGFRSAVYTGATLGTATLAPLLLHGWRARIVHAELGRAPDTLPTRVKNLLSPMVDGTKPLPEWLVTQTRGALELFSELICVAALLGLMLCLWRLRARPEQEEGARMRLALPLFLGGLMTQLAFYKHTADVPRQDVFFLNLAPGFVALAAVLIERVARAVRPLHMGLAPYVVLVGTLMVPCLLRADALRWRWREPGPLDQAGAIGPLSPLPATHGRALASLLPPGEAGLYPAQVGLNIASYYYAWRSLQPIAQVGDVGPAMLQLARYGLEEAPVWFLLPSEEPLRSEPGVVALRQEFEQRLPEHALQPPDATAAGWMGWRLRPRD